jgi:hypothetical protein
MRAAVSASWSRGSGAVADAAADAEIMFIGDSSGEQVRIKPGSALSRPHRLKPLPAHLSL